MQINGCTKKDLNLNELYCKNNHYKKLNKKKKIITCEECGAQYEWKECITCGTNTWTDITCEYCNCAGCETCLANIWKDCAKCGYCLCKYCYHSCEVTNCLYYKQKYCNNHIIQCTKKLCDNYQAYICEYCISTTCNHDDL
jgi:hypothetical protein